MTKEKKRQEWGKCKKKSKKKERQKKERMKSTYILASTNILNR